MTEIVVGEGHNGGAISAKAGDIIVIRLPENPTTGFRWSVESADSLVLQLQSDEFTLSASAGIGGAGLRVFQYLARGVGDTFVALQLARPWEPIAPRSQFKILVTVSP
jgi:inhibitor of cysteine peptidase